MYRTMPVPAALALAIALFAPFGNTLAERGVAQPANSSASLRYFVEHLDDLSAEAIAGVLSALDAEQRLLFAVYPAFLNWAQLLGCQADPTLQVQTSQGAQGCWRNQQDWLGTLQFTGSWDAALVEARTQQADLLIGMRCGSGEYDAQTCHSYFGFQQQTLGIVNRLSERIIDDMNPYACANPGSYLPDGRYCAPQ